jgi:hypothetical protein
VNPDTKPGAPVFSQKPSRVFHPWPIIWLQMIRYFYSQFKLPQCDKYNRMLIADNIFDVNRRYDGFNDL